MTIEQFADLTTLHHTIGERLGNLEHRPSTTILASVNAGGAAWNSGNTAWVDPTTQPEWSELRVSNTLVGSQIWRALSDGTSNVWVVVAG